MIKIDDNDLITVKFIEKSNFSNLIIKTPYNVDLIADDIGFDKMGRHYRISVYLNNQEDGINIYFYTTKDYRCCYHSNLSSYTVSFIPFELVNFS